MPEFGNDKEPGVTASTSSGLGVDVADSSPSDLGIVGQADLASTGSGGADANTVYEVGRVTEARTLFGDESTSLLTQAIIDALNEGAFPIYAVAPTETTVSGEDHSSLGDTNFELDNEPIIEDADSITVTLDSTDLTVNIVYDDTSSYSPAAGECYVNPVRAKVEIPSSPSSSLTVDYTHYDYPSAHDAMVDGAGEDIDYFVPLSENTNIVDDAQTTVNSVASAYELSILKGGAGIRIDPSNYSNPYDDSRTQVVYPTRFEDDSSALAAYGGLCARLGLKTTPINQRFRSDKSLDVRLTLSERGSLIDANVVPLADESNGVRISDDPTTVTSNNTEEKNIEYGFSRLAMDAIIVTTRDNETPFVGRLNNPAVRNTLAGLIRDQLESFKRSDVVNGYSINIEEKSATEALLETNIDLAEPLRFVRNEVTVGDSS